MAQASRSLTSEAAQRYATALFGLAQEKGELTGVSEAFASFAKLARENKDLNRLMNSPLFAREDKTAVLVKVAAANGAPKLLSNFLGTMAQNGRSRDILSAQMAFDELYAKQRGVKRAVARTAKPMTADQQKKLEAILAKAVGGEIELTTEVDDDLIGGIQLRIGSTLVDASLKAKLERMNTAMKGA